MKYLKEMENNPEYFTISVITGWDDEKIFIKVINVGIDSRLEGFTKSAFTDHDGRTYMYFHVSEMQILIRRLLEIDTDMSNLWAENIVEIYYEAEL